MTKLFETTDPRGVKVYLDKDQWSDHISLPAGHIQQKSMLELKKAVEEPNQIWTTADLIYPNREVYFHERTNSTSVKTKYMKVIVDRGEDPAEIVTAFLTPQVKGNIKEKVYEKT